MPKTTKPNRGSRAVFMLALLGAMGAGVLSFYVANNPSARNVPLGLRRPEPVPTAKPQESSTGERVNVPTVNGEKIDLSSTKPVPEGLDPKIVVADTALTIGGFANVRCLAVHVKQGIAYAAFTRGLVDGSGSMGEGDFVRAMQVGMSQFKDIQKVQFLVDGKPVETLGHLELSEPSPVTPPDAVP